MTLQSEYNAWVAEYVASRNATNPLCGQCETASAAMKAQFPELFRVYGKVDVRTWPDYAGVSRHEMQGHWWLEAPDGSVVDPTAGQFESIYRYCVEPNWRESEDAKFAQLPLVIPLPTFGPIPQQASVSSNLRRRARLLRGCP